MFGKPEPLRLLFLEHVLRTSLPPVAWVVEHVVAEGERVLFFGEPATMKSWLLLHLGLHIAAGHKWLDFAVTAPRSVLYVDEEMTERLVRRRMQQLVAGGTPPAADGHFAVASREGVLFNERGGHTLLDQVWRADYKPEVVIIDSMRATLIGDENTQLDVIAFWRAVEPLLRAGLTIIVAHHMRKPRAEGPDAVRHRASGNTAIISGCDSAWAITRPGRAPAITVEAIKNREVQEPPPFAVTFVSDGETGPVSVALGLTPEEASTGGQAVAIILDTLEQGEQTTGALEAACEVEGVSRRTCYRTLESLETQGRIAKVRHGVWALTTPCQ